MRIFVSLLLAFAAQGAAAEMWKCTDQNGNTRYTNVRADAKGCKALNLEPVNTVPATPARVQQKPANFPSVDSDTQRQRDAGRRKILEHELSQEQQQLEIQQVQRERAIALQQAERHRAREKDTDDRVFP